MKYTNPLRTLGAILAAVILAGCSSMDTMPEPAPVAAAPAMIQVPAVTPMDPILIEVPVDGITGGRIAIGTLLDKLNENGCTIGDLVYREVKRGAHVKITCANIDDFATGSID